MSGAEPLVVNRSLPAACCNCNINSPNLVRIKGELDWLSESNKKLKTRTCCSKDLQFKWNDVKLPFPLIDYVHLQLHSEMHCNHVSLSLLDWHCYVIVSCHNKTGHLSLIKKKKKKKK